MTYKKLFIAAFAVMALTSCGNDENEPGEISFKYLIDFSSVTAFNDNDYWKFCYESRYDGTLTFNRVNFSHLTTTNEWDGVKYYTWSGFCPSRSTDKKDYSTDGSWTDHQWSAIPGRGAVGSANYMVGYCSADESEADAATSTTTVIKPTTGSFTPSMVFVTNTTWGYYSMKNGSDFNRAFTKEDWCKLNISAISDNKVQKTLAVYLAKDGNIVDNWLQIDLSPLGKCDRIVFTMESSDTSDWGMNNPSYFCLDYFAWK